MKIYKRTSNVTAAILVGGLSAIGNVATERIALAAPPAVVNSIVNGGAEDGQAQSVPGWRFEAGSLTSDQVSFGISPDASEGKQSLRLALLKPVNAANVWWWQEVVVAPGTKSYAVSCSAKRVTDAARTAWADAGISCYFIGNGNSWLGWQALRSVPDSQGWIPLKANVTVPPGTQRIGIRTGLSCTGVVEAWFDDIRAVPSTDRYLNTLLNGSFEDPIAPVPTGWVWATRSGTPKDVVVRPSPDAADGKQAISVVVLGTGTTVNATLAQRVPITPGIKTYKLSLKSKLVSAAASKASDVTFGYAFLNDTGHEIGFLPMGLVAGTSWEVSTASLMAPPDAQSVEVRVVVEGTGAVEAAFDDVNLVPSP
ncbi:MAG TPA: hypothetical protein VGK19_21065 [Capsulimonadaceae bacterium]|jgi:hypothetical protein